jgi:hypothetical protein
MKLWNRNVLTIAVLGFNMAAFAFGQAQQITITISTPQIEVSAGTPVHLHIVLTNLSQQDISVFRNPGHRNPERFYSISVSDNEGKAWPTTSYGNAILNKGSHAGSKIRTTIKPGEKLEEEATISDIFDMKSAGTYKVVVKRQSPLDPNVLIESNEISITVTD